MGESLSLNVLYDFIRHSLQRDTESFQIFWKGWESRRAGGASKEFVFLGLTQDPCTVHGKGKARDVVH